MKNNKGLLNNLSWKFAERITAQIVTFIVSIILARLLDPAHYGIISIVMIFISIANVFVSNGLGSSLIQKKDADALDFSSVLIFNFFFSIALYTILYFSAPYISMFYNNQYEQLTQVIRILGLRIILSSINSVQHAYVSKEMVFRKFFWSTLFGTLLSAVVGIFLAYRGFGVWALVAQYLTNTTVDTIVLSISLRVKLQIQYSWKRLKMLLPFGARILATNLLIQGYQDLRAIIIGKVYTSSDLAYYDKAKNFPSIIITNINTSISAVLFPKMAEQQNDIASVKEIAKRSIRFSSYIMSPMMLGMAAIANPMVKLLLTEKWLPCVPLLQLLCINSLCLPLHSANMQAIKAIGRSDISLRIEIIKKVIELLILLLVMRISVEAIVIGMVFCSVSFIVINAWPNGKLIGYNVKEQIMDILPGIILSCFMVAIIWMVGHIAIPMFPLLVIQIIIGILAYIAMSVITKNKEYYYILNKIFKHEKAMD